MDVLRTLGLLAGALTLSGCQIGYYAHSAYHQAQLANRRQKIDDALKSDKLSDAQKSKLRLVQDVKRFSEERLGLKPSRNYTSFVQLDEAYVTYIVQAAHAYELKPYLWHFPFVGDVPYKGYFVKAKAEDEARHFDPEKYDTYVRGVSAYSTLGWFQDSVLSSMLRYDDVDLVETIIHETIHTTLYIKSAAEFNERVATFLGHEGMKLYYEQKEGKDSAHLREAASDTADRKIFSEWITREVESLKAWYETNKGHVTKDMKTARLKELQQSFTRDVEPRLKNKGYSEFKTRALNNAMILAYKTYEYSMVDFERLSSHFKGDFKATLAWLKTLERDSKPEDRLKEFVKSP